MLIKPLNKNIVDVFLGKGWNNWGRFLLRFTPQGKQIKQIKGIPFTKAELEEIEFILNPKNKQHNA
jgi:hypothetical protein